ncbi:MAG: VWA domain-containing protein, partial [Planctomycetales bacterium]|nr:VWA domain-containing protein [Planctomycetales bacterium]
ANRRDTIRLKLTAGGQTLAEQPFDVAPGERVWQTRVALAGPEFPALRLTIETPRDTFADNNSLATFVIADQPGRALLVDSEPELAAPLRAALAAAGLEVELVAPDAMPSTDEQWRPYRLAVLSDVSAAALAQDQLAALERFVSAGGGLIATGGERAFSPEAYELTLLERVLPVVATDQPVEKPKSIALVLVVDKSLSMKQQRRLELAKEAAKKVVDVLQTTDQVGVLAFGDDSQWVSRLAPLDSKAEVVARIDGLQASGLTNMFPALLRAQLALSQADADSRHVILLTDGVPTPGDFDDVARQMSDAGVTVSTVSLGAGADQSLLRDISRIARGNHYHVDDPADLPQILERETKSAAGVVAASQFPPVVLRPLPGLDVSTAPPLFGYAATRFKPDAQVLLTIGDGDPLLAWRRYGRGAAVALTADAKNRQARRWQSWNGFRPFWQRLVELAAAPPPDAPQPIAVEFADGRLLATFDAIRVGADGPEFVHSDQAELTVNRLPRGDRPPQSAAMRAIAPGRYAASLPAAAGEALLLEATVAPASGAPFSAERAVVLGYDEEHRLAPADTASLASLATTTGGVYDPRPEEIFAADDRRVDVLTPLWSYLLMAAVVAMVLDVAVRRAGS